MDRLPIDDCPTELGSLIYPTSLLFSRLIFSYFHHLFHLRSIQRLLPLISYASKIHRFFHLIADNVLVSKMKYARLVSIVFYRIDSFINFCSEPIMRECRVCLSVWIDLSCVYHFVLYISFVSVLPHHFHHF